jgi:uncharacterized protein with FMN-binding domain
MRRAFLAITGLAASTTALVVLKGSPGTTQVAQDLPTAQPVSPTPAGGPDPAADPSGGPAAASKPSQTADAHPSPRPSRSTARPSGTRTTTKAPSAPRTTTKAPAPTTRTVTGSEVFNDYGSVQVQIVVSGTRIVDATTVSLPSGPGETEQHSDDVRRAYNGTGGEVVKKQSANLNTVSGATETSNSYKQSLRAAIERAF